MVKDRKKGLKRSNRAAAKPASKKKTLAAKPAKKRSSRASAGDKLPSDAGHHAVFRSLAARSNQHNKAPVCYHQLASGSWMICFLQSDGEYAQCQPYNGPIHQPPCG